MPRTALDALGDELGSPVPTSLATLEHSQLEQLTAAIRAARDRRQAAIESGISGAVGKLPRLPNPFRLRR